jgi:hypothetical protein
MASLPGREDVASFQTCRWLNQSPCQFATCFAATTLEADIWHFISTHSCNQVLQFLDEQKHSVRGELILLQVRLEEAQPATPVSVSPVDIFLIIFPSIFGQN